MLRIWLPLNGDLRNQGLDEVEVTNNGVTFDSAGKLGGCYSFNDNYIQTNYNFYPGINDFSISCWFYLTENTNKTYQHICSFKTTSANSAGIAMIYNRSQQKFLWSTADGSSAQEIWSADTFPTSTIYNTWHHLVMVRDKNDAKHGYFYLNGVRKELASIPTILNITANANTMKIGSCGQLYSTYYWTGKLNDFRIYDHAISPMEVKELSKGLVLHYRLSGIGGENIVPQTSELTLWTKESNVTCVKDGEWFTIADVGERSARWGIYKDNIPIEPNTNYTLHIECVGNTTIQLCTNSSLASKIQPVGNFSGKISETFNTGELFGTDATCYMRMYIWPTYSNNHISKIRYLKIEKGTKPTPWCPNKNDELYSTMGLDDGIEYDTSGFQNNGTQTGTITWNSDSARYNSCYELTGASYINCGKPYDYIVDGSEEFTVNIWAYKDTWDTSTQIYSCTESGGFSLSTGNNSVTCYCHVYGASSVLTNSSGETITNSRGDPILLSTSASYITFTQSYTLNTGWHMFTMVYTKEGLKLYVDGSLARNMSSSSVGLHYNKNCNLFIGAEATGAGGCSSPYLNGKASDLRIFATALSDSDILALYNLGGSLDSNGTFHTYEYVEV